MSAWLATLKHLLALALLALIAAGVLFLPAELDRRWPARWIELEGSFKRVSAEQLRAHLAPQIQGRGLFLLDLDPLRVRAEQLPWVASAELRKRWPESLVLSITEHDPVARLVDGQLVSADGRLFRIAGGHAIQGLPLLDGAPERAPEMLQRYREFGAALAGTGLVIEGLRLSERGGWFVNVVGGMELRVGREQPARRLRRLAAAYPLLNVGTGRVPERIDLRYANGFAIKWRADAPPDPLAELLRDMGT